MPNIYCIKKSSFLAVALILLSIFLSSSALADTYQWSLDGLYGNESFGSQDTHIYILQGVYYFETVDDSNGPLAEAAFLDKASSLLLAYGQRDGDREDGNLYQALLHYVADEKIIMEAGYSRESFEDVNAYTLGVGAYIDDSSSITFNYTAIDSDFADFADAYRVAAQYDNVIALSEERSVAVTARALYEDLHRRGDAAGISALARYYFNRHLSVGGQLSYRDGDDIDAERGYGVSATYFFNSHFGVRVNYDVVNIKHTDDDIETATIAVAARF